MFKDVIFPEIKTLAVWMNNWGSISWYKFIKTEQWTVVWALECLSDGKGILLQGFSEDILNISNQEENFTDPRFEQRDDEWVS